MLKYLLFAPVFAALPIGACDHVLVGCDHYFATAHNVTSDTMGVSVSGMTVTAKGNNGICVAKMTTFDEVNDDPGFQPGEDNYIDSKSQTVQTPSTSLSIAAMSDRGANGRADHWQLELEVYRRNASGGWDHLGPDVHHASF